MGDRELLELAAKAAGIKVRWHSESFYGPTMEVMEGEEGGPPWNPLTDDGDALRLAVKLGIDLMIYGEVVGAFSGKTQYSEPDGADKYAATRRAIVRAAAAIGAKGEM